MASSPNQLSQSIADFSAEVRASSVKRFRMVRPADRAWTHRPDLLSFVDVLQHLADADRWLFDNLDGKEVPPGVVISPGDADPSTWDQFLNELIELGERRSQRIA